MFNPRAQGIDSLERTLVVFCSGLFKNSPTKDFGFLLQRKAGSILTDDCIRIIFEND